MKFFKKDKQTDEFFLLDWKHGYIQFWHEWDQIFYKRFNWITFALIDFHIERELGDGISVELALFGFHLRLHSLWNYSKVMKQLGKDVKQVKKDIKAGKKFKKFV